MPWRRWARWPAVRAGSSLAGDYLVNRFTPPFHLLLLHAYYFLPAVWRAPGRDGVVTIGHEADAATAVALKHQFARMVLAAPLWHVSAPPHRLFMGGYA